MGAYGRAFHTFCGDVAQAHQHHLRLGGAAAGPFAESRASIRMFGRRNEALTQVENIEERDAFTLNRVSEAAVR